MKESRKSTKTAEIHWTQNQVSCCCTICFNCLIQQNEASQKQHRTNIMWLFEGQNYFLHLAFPFPSKMFICCIQMSLFFIVAIHQLMLYSYTKPASLIKFLHGLTVLLVNYKVVYNSWLQNNTNVCERSSYYSYNKKAPIFLELCKRQKLQMSQSSLNQSDSKNANHLSI